MRTIHIVSHTHWDREWYLTFQQFRLKLVKMIDNLLDILDSDAEFQYFTLDGQTIVLRDYVAIRPGKGAVIKKYIHDGRLLIGPWYVLPDSFLVGPESHIRNLLEGERICQDFGGKMGVGYVPDTFGHIGQLPQILMGFGIDNACLWRGLDEQPCEFWWSAPDGTRVLMAYLRQSYSNGAGLTPGDAGRFSTDVSRLAASLAEHSITQDVLIMNGNDHMQAQPGLSSAISSANQLLSEQQIVHSCLPNYLEKIKGQISTTEVTLPVVTGELRSSRHAHLLPGIASARMWIKQRNRHCEMLLSKWAEPFSTWAGLLAEQLPVVNSDSLEKRAEVLRYAWRLLMECHPHDSIGGCSIDQVHEEMQPRFAQVEQIAEAVIQQSLQEITDQVNTQPPESLAPSATQHECVAAILVFNPHDSELPDLVNVDIELPEGITQFEIVDDKGQAQPHHVTLLGNRPLFDVSLDPTGFKNSLDTIHDGEVLGMAVTRMNLTRHEDSVVVDVSLSENGKTNESLWLSAQRRIDELLADKTIHTFTIHGRSSAITSLALIPHGVPAHGYRCFWVRQVSGSLSPAPAPIHLGWLQQRMLRMLKPALGYLPLSRLMRRRQSQAANPPYEIENEFFSVQANARNGTLTILDKRSGVNYSGLNHFMDGGDRGDEYNYSAPAAEQVIIPHLDFAEIIQNDVEQKMALHLSLQVPQALAEDRKTRSRETCQMEIISDIRLQAGVPRIDIRSEVDNLAEDHRLRVHFPAPFSAQAASHDGHFEVVRRAIGIPAFDDAWIEAPRPEVPQRLFTSVSHGDTGLTIANRGLPEVEVLKNEQGNAEIALTLLRCVGWLSRDDFPDRRGHAGPYLPTPEAQMKGKHIFEYSIIPHPGDWLNAYLAAYAFETPLRAISTCLHPGELACDGTAIKSTNTSFIISAIKPAEDNHGWIVRGYNIQRVPILETLSTSLPLTQFARCNLAEKAISSLPGSNSGEISFSVRGAEIISLRLEQTAT